MLPINAWTCPQAYPPSGYGTPRPEQHLPWPGPLLASSPIWSSTTATKAFHAPSAIQNPMPVAQSAFPTVSPNQTQPHQGAHHHQHSSEPSEQAKDLYRDTPLRYLGYLNELGESLKDWLKASPLTTNNADGIVKHSYTAVGGYVALDAFDKAAKGYQQSKKAGDSKGGQVLSATTSGLDAALFQYGASYSIPAFLVAVTRDSLKLGLNRLLGKQKAAEEILQHEISHEIEAKGWYRFDQRLLGKLKKGIDDHLLQKIKPSQKFAEMVQKWGPKAEQNLCIALPLIGSMAIIPLIVHPIDTGVNFILDHSYRPLAKWLKHWAGAH